MHNDIERTLVAPLRLLCSRTIQGCSDRTLIHFFSFRGGYGRYISTFRHATHFPRTNKRTLGGICSPVLASTAQLSKGRQAMITAAAASPSNSARTAQTALEEDLQSNVALQQHVFLISLERLVGCLQNPSDRSRGLCEELGVPHGDLAEAIFRKKLQQGERQQQQAEVGSLTYCRKTA